MLLAKVLMNDCSSSLLLVFWYKVFFILLTLVYIAENLPKARKIHIFWKFELFSLCMQCQDIQLLIRCHWRTSKIWENLEFLQETSQMDRLLKFYDKNSLESDRNGIPNPLLFLVTFCFNGSIKKLRCKNPRTTY